MGGWFALLGVVLSAALAQAQSDWTFQTEKNGIKVYTAGHDSSDFKSVRAIFEVEATLSQYAAIVWNVAEYKYWNFAATNPRVLKKISESELIYYTEAKAPWPITDRFVVLHLKIVQDPASKIMRILLNNAPDQIPEQEGFVRIPAYQSVARVVPVSDTRVRVEYTIHVDPGGSIPAWAVNMVSAKMPITSFTNLKERVKQQGDERPSVPFVSDKILWAPNSINR